MQLQAPLRTVTPTLDGDVLNALARVDGELTISALERHSQRHRTRASGSCSGDSWSRELWIGARSERDTPTGSNRDHLAAPAIIALATLSDQFRARVADRVGMWSHWAVFVGLFGSAATGEMQP